MQLYVGGCGQNKLRVVLESREKEVTDKKKSACMEASGVSRAGECGETAETKPYREDSGETGSPDVFYGEDMLSGRVFQCRIINHFHLILKKLPSSDIPLFLEELYEKNPDVTIICDEVGNGIVPVDREERAYREQVGKSCQWLAARSRRVVRIVCGCMQVLKEEKEPVIRLCFIRHGETEGNLEKRYVGRTDEPLSPTGREHMEQLKNRLRISGNISPENHVKLYISPMRRCRESAEVLFPPDARGHHKITELRDSPAIGERQEIDGVCSIDAVSRLGSVEAACSTESGGCREAVGQTSSTGEADCREVPDFRECDFGAFEYRNYHELMQDEKLSALYQAWIDSGGTLPFPEGEAADEFKKRCLRAFREIMEREKKDQASVCRKAKPNACGRAESGNTESGNVGSGNTESENAGTENTQTENAKSEYAESENAKTVMFVVHGGTIMSILEAYGEPKKGYYDYQVPCADGYVCDYLPEKDVITNIERL